jgi:hypothetical protein
VRLALELRPSLEMGSLRAAASVRDPDVRVEGEPDQEAVLRIVEGAVDVSLAFPDTPALQRFQRRVARLRMPGPR